MKSVRILLGILLLLGLVKISFSQEEAAPVAVAAEEVMDEVVALNEEDMVNAVMIEDDAAMVEEKMEEEVKEDK